MLTKITDNLYVNLENIVTITFDPEDYSVICLSFCGENTIKEVWIDEEIFISFKSVLSRGAFNTPH